MLFITLFCFIMQACCMLYRPPVVRQQSVYSVIPDRRTHRNCCFQFVSKRTKVRKAFINNAKNVIVHRNNIRATPKAKFLQLVKLFTFDQLQKPENLTAELQQIGITKSDIENPFTATKGGKFETLLKTLASNESSGVTSRNEKSHTGDIKEHYYMSSEKFNKILEQLAENAGRKQKDTSTVHEDDGSAASADNETISKNEDFQRLQNMAFLSNLFSQTIQRAINQTKIRYNKASENAKKAENATSLENMLDQQNGKDNFVGHLNSLINMLDSSINNITEKDEKSPENSKEKEIEDSESPKEKVEASPAKETSHDNAKEDVVKTEPKEKETNEKLSEEKVIVKPEQPKDEPKKSQKGPPSNMDSNVTKALASYLDDGKPFLSSNDSLKRLEAATDAFIGKSNNDSSIKEFFELLKLLTMNKLGVSHTTIQILSGDDKGSSAKNAKLAAKNERNHYHYQVFPQQADKAQSEGNPNTSKVAKGTPIASNLSPSNGSKDKDQNKTHNLVSLGKLSDIKKMEKLLDLLSNTTENNDWKQNVYLDVSIRKFEDLLKHILTRKATQKAAASSSKDKDKQNADSNEHRSKVDTYTNSYVSLLNLSQWIDNPNEFSQYLDTPNKNEASAPANTIVENSNSTLINDSEDAKELSDVQYKGLSHLSYYDMPQDGDTKTDELPDEHQRRHHASRMLQGAVVEKLEKVLKLITLRQLIHDLPNEEAHRDPWEDRGETKSRIRYIQKFNHLLKLIALDRLRNIKD